MRKVALLCLLVLAAGALALAPEAKLTEFLQGYMEITAEDELLPCYITLSTQLDKATAAQLAYGNDRQQTRLAVSNWLKTTAAHEQADLLDYLLTAQATGAVGDYQSFWLSNFVFAELSHQAIHEIAQRPEVVLITRGSDRPDLFAGLGFPAETGGELITMYTAPQEITWGVSKIRAPIVWSTQNITGAGVSVAIADTGQRYTHYDLISRYAPGLSYDFMDNNNNPWYGSGEDHGTHCAGTVASDGTAGTQAGVAPGCTYAAHRLRMYMTYQGELSAWASWQFAVDNGIDVVSNSYGWTNSGNPARPTWRANAQNAIAAGVVLVVAAGNEGPGFATLRCPGDVPEVITVGATDATDTIADFSSRGPSTAHGENVIKPDVVAPGVNTKSCYITHNSAYISGWSGTSMACPHVAGTVALILERAPDLTPNEIKQILEDTADKTNAPTKNNIYGSGRVDALNAIMYLSDYDATYVDVDTSRSEDGVLVSWQADADYFAYNVYRESAGESRVMLNEHALKGGDSGSWLDRPDLGTHSYFVEGINVGGESFLFGPVEVIVTAPIVSLSLSEPFPNPTPGRVSFNLTVTDAEPVSLVVYDISGRRVATIHEGSLAAGRHTLTWDAEAPSGVYLVRLEAAGQTITRRVVLDR